ncbi:MAG: nitrogenase cofactor biosynthesis protein NifB [Alphaproteobacteria bacterium]|nr:nitrogenase cofactor biosynthesis protein NifB [Alphaproteobacteria bacterium]TAD90411.1 MAG: nitrogenase cofactor biosynthesis protein NifB [Alphaproteobacteria bacterium]
MQPIAISGILPSASVADIRQTLESGGCSTTDRCGASAGPDDLPAAVWERIKDHPCYSEEAHHYFARMHVAVAPACNIQCNYCNRKYDCANESRPGVVSERLTPDQAVRKVVAVANEIPQLSVLGVAGPGDSLYDARKTFATFDLVAKAIPDIKFCVSTNGLALPDYVDELAQHNIDHVTITINMIDPTVGEQIYPWIYFRNRRWTGLDAAKILHERQMEGLEAVVAKGILVKINSVMIPGINDHHLMDVNAAVRARGAFLHNVMPLISDAAHGTAFGLSGQRGPTPQELKGLQDQLGGGANLMKHCRQCRADAVGLLGEDRGQEFTLDQLPDEVVYDPARRSAYRDVVEAERDDRRAAARAADQALATARDTLLIAITTKGGGRINQHFGHATEFQVYEVDRSGVRFVGHRRADNYCLGGHGDDDRLESVIAALEGIDAILTAKIGDCPRDRLEQAGLVVLEDWATDYIEPAAAAAYQRLREAPPLRRSA